MDTSIKRLLEIAGVDISKGTAQQLVEKEAITNILDEKGRVVGTINYKGRVVSSRSKEYSDEEVEYGLTKGTFKRQKMDRYGREERVTEAEHSIGLKIKVKTPEEVAIDYDPIYMITDLDPSMSQADFKRLVSSKLTSAEVKIIRDNGLQDVVVKRGTAEDSMKFSVYINKVKQMLSDYED